MTLEELIDQYQGLKNIIKHNDNADWDYDPSVLNVKFEIGNEFEGSSTKKLEDNTVKLLQEFFDNPIELKNATAGVKGNYATLLVEHHQHKRIEDELVPSGILLTKAGHTVFGIDDVGFYALKKEFLLWCYEYNLKTKIMKDGPIESQKGGNQGYAFLISYDTLSFLITKYKEHLKKL